MTTLGHLEKPVVVGLSVSPDRRQVIYDQLDKDTHYIMLV